jgi:hypothetical protein
MYLDPQMPNAWKRDEFVPVTVTSDDDDVDSMSVTMSLGTLDAGSANPAQFVVQLSDAGCGHAYCGSATLDMSVPLMNAFNGALPLSLSGRDLAGNASSLASLPQVPVTRWRWALDAGLGSLSFIGPAVGSTGVVYLVGSTNSDTVTAITPNGQSLWSWKCDAGAITTSPLVGDFDGGIERVYVGASGGQVFALDGVSSSPAPVCVLPGPGSPMEPALSKTLPFGQSQAVETAFFANFQQVVAVRPDAIASRRCNTYPLANGLSTGLIVDGTDIAFADLSTLHSIRLSQDAFVENWTSPSPYPVTIAAVGGNIAVGNGIDPTVSSIIAFDRLDGGIAWSVDSGQPFELWDQDGHRVLMADMNSANMNEISQFPVGAQNSSATYLGNGSDIWRLVAGADGILYGAFGGGVAAFDGSLRPLWSQTSTNAPPFEPALDCARDDNGAIVPGRPGTLYAASRWGLEAVIVDSHGLNASSSWPKHQHDSRNTGNLTTTASQCP